MEGSPLNRIARSVLLALVVALSCAIAAPLARGQNLPDEIVQSGSPDAGPIEQFLNNTKIDNQPLLDALAKPELAARARKQIGEPLQRSSARPSASFRRTYSRLILPKVGPLAKDPSDDVAVNALRLCGLLGTKEALDVAVTALDDPRESVRIAAASAIATGLASGQRPDAAFSERQATDILDAVNARLSKEKAPLVFEALILSLDFSARIPDRNLPGVRSRAMDLLLGRASELAGKLSGPEFDQLFGNIAKGISDALKQDEKFSAAQTLSASKAAADIVARIVRRVEAGELAEAQRTELALVAEQAEFIVKLNGGKSYGLAALLRAPDDAKFKAKAAELINDAKKNP